MKAKYKNLKQLELKTPKNVKLHSMTIHLFKPKCLTFTININNCNTMPKASYYSFNIIGQQRFYPSHV